jgi:hypothetical protein
VLLVQYGYELVVSNDLDRVDVAIEILRLMTLSLMNSPRKNVWMEYILEQSPYESYNDNQDCLWYMHNTLEGKVEILVILY